MKCAFRRYHSESTVARLEVGLQFGTANIPAAAPIDALALLRRTLSLSVKVTAPRSPPRAAQLVDAGELLARHLLMVTTRHRPGSDTGPEDWWLSPGPPAVIIEHDRDLVFPPHTRHVLSIPAANSSLAHTWLDVGKQRCSVWFLSSGDADPDAKRRLRIHLVRLHAERECLRSVLIHLKTRLGSDLAVNGLSADSIKRYLNDTVRVLRKSMRHGLHQQPILEAARHALDISFEGDTTTLVWAGREVVKKIDDFVRQAAHTATVINQYCGSLVMTNIRMGNVEVHGAFNVVTAANIQNSFNKAGDARAGDDLREKLRALTIAVAKLAERLPRDDAESVTVKLATLVSEAASPHPCPERYAPAAQRIVVVARSIADLAASVATAVSDVIAILGA